MRTFSILSIFVVSLLFLGCGGTDRLPVDGDGGTDTAMPDAAPPELTLRTGAPVSMAPVYASTTFRNPLDRNDEREWIPVDVTNGPWGEVWIIQRAERSGAFDDVTECTERAISNRDPSDDDCYSLLGSTVGIADPRNPEMADDINGRALQVVDANSLHFMARPSGIAFGADETTIEPGHPGAMGRDGSSLISEPVTYIFPFATCAEAGFGNYTDTPPFIGPSLWTADPAIYDGTNGTAEYSNGSHLDMVHGTRYCTGIAWERVNVYWAINGEADAFDKYDFGAPHLTGHFYHEDASITRYQWEGNGPVRVNDVPSNAMVDSGMLYVADSGNGRIIGMAIDAEGTPAATWYSFERLECDRIANAPLEVVVDEATLAAEWGGAAVPSGLGVLDSETLVVANNATGHISLIGLDGTIVRTIDTGTGSGIGGLTVFEGIIFFVHMTERRLYRIDVETGVPAS